LQPISLAAGYDIDHSSNAFFASYDGGKMDGFDLEQVAGDTTGYPHPQYGYVPHAESKLYFEMAHRYVLGDRMFTSHLDGSFVSHQYAIAAQAHRAVDFPSTVWGCDGGSGDVVPTLLEDRQIGPSEVACFDYQTLGDELDRAGLSWRYYTPSRRSIWAGYQAVKHIRYGPHWQQNIVVPASRVVSDARDGSLPAVSWVVPTNADSDHAGAGSTTGPEWIADVVNGIGRSRFWDSTAIFIMWDEWGGWYDHVKPPYVNYDGLGMRVPLLVIYEHGSILRFIEDRFGLGRLAASDARANSPEADCFDFTQPPRPFKAFKTTLSEARLFAQPNEEPDSE
jgi:phospholipase C